MNSTVDCFPPPAGDETSESRNVLVYDTGAGWVVGFYCHEDEMWCSYPEGVEMFDATHWQELPDAPE